MAAGAANRLPVSMATLFSRCPLAAPLTRGLKGSSRGSHCGSGRRSMRLLLTMGLTELSVACQMRLAAEGPASPEVEARSGGSGGASDLPASDAAGAGRLRILDLHCTGY